MISSKENIEELFELLEQDSELFKNYVLELIDRLHQTIKTRPASPIDEFIEKEKLRLIVQSKKLEKSTSNYFKDIRSEIDELIKENKSFVTSNYFLEYKQKDLLLLTNELEEINEELEKQKKQIEEQAKELEKNNEQILIQNEQLQQQKDYIMDQADYLHEANESISRMHEEVQIQKEQILQKNEELIQLNKEKNNLIGIVAHDLKSPLNQIKGLITILKYKKDELGNENLNYIEIIEKSTSKLTEMINKILDVEAIDSKKINIKYEEMDLGLLLKDISENYRVLADKKNIQLNLSIKSRKNVLRLDQSYCSQIMENLISNAIKFSPFDKNIFITLKKSRNQVITEIRDEGPGLSEKDKTLLFSKYQKLSARPTGDELSTGLGLNIVKKYTELMKGKIWCESKQGEGASFFVSFPIEQK